MLKAQRLVNGFAPAILRLSRLSPLGERDMAALALALHGQRQVRSRFELLTEGREVGEPRLIVSGWAARVRLLADGRRQFLSFLLPGDLIGICHHPLPLATSTIVTLTNVALCVAPQSAALPHLDAAFAISQALDQSYLLAHVTRLGRLNAQERIADLLLEFHERLGLAGLAGSNSFDVPLTQEVLADALGLTAVHVNRMLQTMRRDDDIDWKGGQVTLRDPAALAHKIGRTPPRVTELQP